jgi:hypothetical protein
MSSLAMNPLPVSFELVSFRVSFSVVAALAVAAAPTVRQDTRQGKDRQPPHGYLLFVVQPLSIK